MAKKINKTFLLFLIVFFLLGLSLFFTLSYKNKESMENHTEKNNEKNNDKNNEKKSYEIGPSTIHGKGVLCKSFIKEGDLIDVAIIMDKENKPIATQYFGQFINHKKDANSLLHHKLETSEYLSFAKKDIFPGDEITCNYDAPNMPWFILGSEEDYIP